MLTFDQNFMDNLENTKEERDIVVSFLHKVGIRDPYDDTWDNSYEFIQNKVAKQVNNRDSFNLKAVETEVNKSFVLFVDIISRSAYIDILELSGAFKLNSIKAALETTKKGLIALYYDEYERFVRREAKREKEKKIEARYKELIDYLNEI